MNNYVIDCVNYIIVGRLSCTVKHYFTSVTIKTTFDSAITTIDRIKTNSDRQIFTYVRLIFNFVKKKTIFDLKKSD